MLSSAKISPMCQYCPCAEDQTTISSLDSPSDPEGYLSLLRGIWVLVCTLRLRAVAPTLPDRTFWRLMSCLLFVAGASAVMGHPVVRRVTALREAAVLVDGQGLRTDRARGAAARSSGFRSPPPS